MALAIEVVAIGNEILTGSTINTNAAFIGNALLEIGLKVTGQRTFPDEPKILKYSLKDSLEHNDLIICTGGLGPTCDDLTRQAIADVFDCELKFEPKIADFLQQRYQSSKVSIRDQAMIPSKANYILNEIGTASALIFNENDKIIIFLPGVPAELEYLMRTKIIPILQAKYKSNFEELHQECNFFQLTESKVDPVLRELQVKYPLVEFGIYPKLGVISVHIISHFSTYAENISYQEPIKLELIAAFKDNYFSDSTSDLAVVVCELCKQKELSLALVQTSTDLNLVSRLGPVLVGAVYSKSDIKPEFDCDITVIVTGLPEFADDTTVCSADLVVSLINKNLVSTTKTYSVRGTRKMLKTRSENLVLSEIFAMIKSSF